MYRHVVQRLTPVGSVVNHQVQRNLAVSAVAAQKAGSLDPIQQLFVDKIREYRTKSAGGKLVDATPASQATLTDMLTNLERGYGAKGQDMTQFPTFNFQDPALVWPGFTDEQKQKMYDAAESKMESEMKAAAPEEEKFDPFEGYR